MRATIRIVNLTRFRTDQLRAFVVRARDQVFEIGDRRRLVVHFRPSRRICRGRASIGGGWSTVWIPARMSSVEELKQQLAQILVHELAHNAGAKGERWMRHGTRFGWGPGWRDNVPWSVALPLELQAERPAPPPTARIETRLARVAELQQRWGVKAKRAASALRKLIQEQRRLERRLAAARGQA